MGLIKEIFEDSDYDQLNNMVRWNGLNRIKEESVAHHSFIVSFFARAISEELFPEDILTRLKLEIVTYSIFHDFDEMFSGDVLHGVKYNDENGEKLRELLDDFVKFKVEEKFGSGRKSPFDKMMKKFLNSEIHYLTKGIVKLSDWLSMLYYIKREKELGNTYLNKHYSYCLQRTLDHTKQLKIDIMSENANGYYKTGILTNLIETLELWIENN